MWMRLGLLSCLLTVGAVAKMPYRNNALDARARKKVEFREKPTKRQVFLFSPAIANEYRGVGVAYRLRAPYGFFDIELSQKIEPVFFSNDTVPSVRSRIGNTYENSWIAGRALSTNFRYLNPYILGGLGFTYLSQSSTELGQSVSPTAALKLGIDFKYGFYDIGIAKPFAALRCHFRTQRGGILYETPYELNILYSQRIGIGFAF